MNVLQVTIVVMCGGFIAGLPFKKTDINVLRRNTRSTDGLIGCIHMESAPGELRYISDGSLEVCGLYLVGQPDQIVEIEFLEFNVHCETGGVLAMFDGWELNGELFPDTSDHEMSMAERYKTYCGEHKPNKLTISSQNVALLQFRLPEPGEGFKVIVNFKTNPKPCNAVTMFEQGILTMKNFGLKRNCTTSIIYPEKIHLLNVDVGVTSERKTIDVETGLSDQQCMKYGSGDYIQLKNGNGLDTSLMTTREVICGSESNSDKSVQVVLGCQHSVVRMVSSGQYYNTVTFMYNPPDQDDLTDSTSLC